MDFKEVRESVYAFHAAGDYQAGLAVLDGFQPSDDGETAAVAFWRMCFLSLLGESRLALAEFRSALGRGSWWNEAMLSDPDLDKVRHMPEWEELEKESLARVPILDLDDLTPLYERPADWHYGHPSLIVFHGAGSRPDLALEHFRPVLDLGFRLIAPHGTEPMSVGRFAWPWADTEKAVLHQLGRFDPIEAPAILAGYSQGAGVAAYLAWCGAIEAAGLIMVAASLRIRGIPCRGADLHPVPTYIVTGTDDPVHGDSLEAARSLESSNVPVFVDNRRGLAHAYPEDFAETLAGATSWIFEQQG